MAGGIAQCEALGLIPSATIKNRYGIDIDRDLNRPSVRIVFFFFTVDFHTTLQSSRTKSGTWTGSGSWFGVLDMPLGGLCLRKDLGQLGPLSVEGDAHRPCPAGPQDGGQVSP